MARSELDIHREEVVRSGMTNNPTNQENKPNDGVDKSKRRFLRSLLGLDREATSTSTVEPVRDAREPQHPVYQTPRPEPTKYTRRQVNKGLAVTGAAAFAGAFGLRELNMNRLEAAEDEGLTDILKVPQADLNEDLIQTLNNQDIKNFAGRNPEEYSSQEAILTPDQYAALKDANLFRADALSSLQRVMDANPDSYEIFCIAYCDNSNNMSISIPMLRVKDGATMNINNGFPLPEKSAFFFSGRELIHYETPDRTLPDVDTKVTFSVYSPALEAYLRGSNFAYHGKQLNELLDNLKYGDILMFQTTNEEHPRPVSMALENRNFPFTVMLVGAGARMRPIPDEKNTTYVSTTAQARYVTTFETTLEDVRGDSKYEKYKDKIQVDSTKNRFYFKDDKYTWYLITDKDETDKDQKGWAADSSISGVGNIDSPAIASTAVPFETSIEPGAPTPTAPAPGPEAVATPALENKYPLGENHQTYEGGRYFMYLEFEEGSGSDARFTLVSGFDCYYSAIFSYEDANGNKRRVRVPLVVVVTSGENMNHLYFYGKADGGFIDDATKTPQSAFNRGYSSFAGQTKQYILANKLGTDRRWLKNPKIAFMKPVAQVLCSDSQFEAFARTGDPSVLPVVNGEPFLPATDPKVLPVVNGEPILLVVD